MSFPVEITGKAIIAAYERLSKRGTPHGAVRLGIKGGGCSGFQYSITFDDDPPRPSDFVFEAIGGFKFYVDKKSAIYLSGSTLDWVEKGIVSKGFEFRNPQVASTCGCGTSFTVK